MKTSPDAMVQMVQAGAELLVRLNPHRVPLCQHDGTPLDLVAALKHQPQVILRSFPVVMGTPTGATRAQGWVHAYRLAAPEAANAGTASTSSASNWREARIRSALISAR